MQEVPGISGEHVRGLVMMVTGRSAADEVLLHAAAPAVDCRVSAVDCRGGAGDAVEDVSADAAVHALCEGGAGGRGGDGRGVGGGGASQHWDL